MMKELKEGAMNRIRTVLSVYRQKELTVEEKLIVKEYETMLLLLADGYVNHTFYKFVKYLLAVLIGFALSVLSHHVFGLIH